MALQKILSLVVAAVYFLGSITATPLDDYVWRYDENYKWEDMVSKKQDLTLSVF
jgi:hypothetical protein